jgi:hypothetical protein
MKTAILPAIASARRPPRICARPTARHCRPPVHVNALEGRTSRGLKPLTPACAGAMLRPMCNLWTVRLRRDEVKHLLSHCGLIGKNFGDDDQIVPYADSAPLSAKLLKNGTLKTYKGFPHGMPSTEAKTINAGLLAFIKG